MDYQSPCLILKVARFKSKYVQYLMIEDTEGESLYLYVCTSTAAALVSLRFTNYIGESYCFSFFPGFFIIIPYYFFLDMNLCARFLQNYWFDLLDILYAGSPEQGPVQMTIFISGRALTAAWRPFSRRYHFSFQAL